MIHYLLSSKEVGNYALAVAMADMVYIFPSMMGTVLFPKICSQADKSQMWGLTKKVKPFFWILMLFLTMTATGIVTCIVSSIFGNKYQEAIPAFIYLMPGILFWGASFPDYLFLTAIGLPKQVLFIWFFLLCFNVFFNIIYIKSYGILGAAIISSITYLIGFILFAVYARRLRHEPKS